MENNMNKWSEYQQYIQIDTLRIEKEYKELILYRCLCTQMWKNQYFLVLQDNILLTSDEIPYNEYEIAKSVYNILSFKSSNEQSTNINSSNTDKKKYNYEISYDCAEGFTMGLICLTEAEAKIVHYAMNTDNWTRFEADLYGAEGSIDIEHPIEIGEN